MVTLYPAPTEIGGVRLKNHLLLAAGILGTTGASLARLLRNGAGGVVTKSIGPSPKEGHRTLPGRRRRWYHQRHGSPEPSAAFVDELASLQGEPVVVRYTEGRRKSSGRLLGGSPA